MVPLGDRTGTQDTCWVILGSCGSSWFMVFRAAYEMPQPTWGLCRAWCCTNWLNFAMQWKSTGDRKKKDTIPMRSCKTFLASKANYPNPGGACIYAHREAAVKYKEIWNTLVNGKHLKVGCRARAPSPCLFLPFYAKKWCHWAHERSAFGSEMPYCSCLLF